MNSKPTPDEVEGFYSSVEELERRNSLRSYVQDSINSQTVAYFEHLEVYAESLEKLMGRPRSAARASKSFTSLRELIGFELECKPSSIPDAGDGVFVKLGRCSPGTVVAYFPGFVHVREFTTKADYIKRLLPDDDFMLFGRCRSFSIIYWFVLLFVFSVTAMVSFLGAMVLSLTGGQRIKSLSIPMGWLIKLIMYPMDAYQMFSR